MQLIKDNYQMASRPLSCLKDDIKLVSISVFVTNNYVGSFLQRDFFVFDFYCPVKTETTHTQTKAMTIAFEKHDHWTMSLFYAISSAALAKNFVTLESSVHVIKSTDAS